MNSNDLSLSPSFAFSYTFNPSAATLVRSNISNSAGTRILLRGCDYVIFNVSQRRVTNNFQFYSTASQPTLTKLVDVSWKCSRKKWSTSQLNTESVQTAKIVLRN